MGPPWLRVTQLNAQYSRRLADTLDKLLVESYIYITLWTRDCHLLCSLSELETLLVQFFFRWTNAIPITRCSMVVSSSINAYPSSGFAATEEDRYNANKHTG